MEKVFYSSEVVEIIDRDGCVLRLDGDVIQTWDDIYDKCNVSHLVLLPTWLADGIRELVKNKIEEENDKGA